MCCERPWNVCSKAWAPIELAQLKRGNWEAWWKGQGDTEEELQEMLKDLRRKAAEEPLDELDKFQNLLATSIFKTVQYLHIFVNILANIS